MQIKSQIIQPTLLLDKQKCLSNIKSMVGKCKSLGLELRPHFKTHQSNEIGNWFKDQGVKKITVSSLRMADYFTNGGWSDITIAFPVNVLEIHRIQQLCQKIQLNLLVESLESIQIIASKLTNPCGIFIKIDVGTHRTGIQADNHFLLNQLIQYIENDAHLKFKGFLAHAGHTYHARSKKEIKEVHLESIKILDQLRRKFVTDYPDIIISYGDTPSSCAAEHFPGIDEIRPGNFVFFDLTQVEIGSCSANHIAVAMACPVVAKHQNRNEVIVYGGGVHFSKEQLEMANGDTIYGQIAEWDNGGWKLPSQPSYLKSVSQEHGVISAHPSLMANLKIGDVLPILPVHSCMTADLMKSYLLTNGRTITDFLSYS